MKENKQTYTNNFWKRQINYQVKKVNNNNNKTKTIICNIDKQCLYRKSSNPFLHFIFSLFTNITFYISSHITVHYSFTFFFLIHYILSIIMFAYFVFTYYSACAYLTIIVYSTIIRYLLIWPLSF